MPESAFNRRGSSTNAGQRVFIEFIQQTFATESRVQDGHRRPGSDMPDHGRVTPGIKRLPGGERLPGLMGSDDGHGTPYAGQEQRIVAKNVADRTGAAAHR